MEQPEMHWVADVNNMDGRSLGLFRRSLRDFPVHLRLGARPQIVD